MPSKRPAISVRNVAKDYRIFGHPGERVKQAISLGFKRYYKKFTALRNISFDVEKGETVGIIGLNGSGKSTLLQLICGILKPTTGAIQVDGRISAMLELGAGFNPEFTGRENVYFQSALMGLKKSDIDARFNDIAAFADIGEFIEQPVRTYSSGMFMRLALAVAVHVEPDILIVDEALSVGDIVFQHKSRKRLQRLIDSGASLLMVSHDRETITAICKRCILLSRGEVVMDGAPSDVFDYYHALAAAKDDDKILINHFDSGRTQFISGTGEASVEQIQLLDENHQEINAADVGMPVTLAFSVHVKRPLPRLVMGFTIRDRNGQALFGTNTNNFGQSLPETAPGSRLVFQFTFRANIGVGHYSVSTALVSTNDRFTNNYECRELAFFFEVQNISRPPFGGSVWLNPSLAVQRK